MPDEDDEPTFFQRYRWFLIIGGILVIGLAVFFLQRKPEPKKKAAPAIMNIMPPLPPPPPPPTPPPTPPPQEPPPEPEQKQPEFEPEEKPVEEPKPEPPAPDEPPAAPLGTDLQGDGADGFGLSGRGNGMIGGTGTGGRGPGGSKWGWYAGQVQSRVVDALQRNKRTKSAAMSIKVRIWADATGRVTRASIAGSSGDPAVDRALEQEVLTGLQLSQPPPEGMPMPIVLRITAKRPH